MRTARPWYWKARKGWYVHIDRKRHKLADDPDPRRGSDGMFLPSQQAMLVYERLMGLPRNGNRRGQMPDERRTWREKSLGDLIFDEALAEFRFSGRTAPVTFIYEMTSEVMIQVTMTATRADSIRPRDWKGLLETQARLEEINRKEQEKQDSRQTQNEE